jgi:uncharacterized protein (TIGR02118 family)
MIRVTILYPNTPGSRFDFDYYLNTHMPMAGKLLAPALKGMVVEQGMMGTEPGSPPAYSTLCHLSFDSIEAFLEVFLPHQATLQGDFVNYTDVAPVIQFSEVKIAG